MNQDDFHDDFLKRVTDNSLGSQQQYPDWVSQKNSSFRAYNAVMQLFETKKDFIKKHKNKSDFKYKFSYQIKKTEVAEMTGAKMQPLFNTVSYSESLKKLFDNINKELLELKDEKLSKSYSGNKSKTKQELIKNAQTADEKYRILAMQSAERMLELALEKMPLSTKQKLGLN